MGKFKFDEIVINSTAKKKPTNEDKSTYIGLEHLESSSLTINRFGSEVAPIGEKLLMKKGDILFGKRRAYQKKVAIAPFDGIFSAHGLVLRPKEDVIDKSFFPFFISSDYFLDKAIKISVGSLSPTINWSDLKILEFNLPDLPKQKRLAEVLWKIEDDILIKKQATEKARELLFLKVKEYFKLSETGKEYSISQLTKPSKKSTIKASVGKDVGNYIFYTSGQENKLINEYLVDGEYLVLNTGGAMQTQYATGKFAYSTDTLVLSCNEDVETKFLYYFLYANNEIFNEHFFRGSGLKHLNRNEFLKVKIKIPTKDEQVELIEKWSQLDILIEEMQEGQNLLKKLQKQIINEVL